MTWFKKDDSIHWVVDVDGATAVVQNFLK
jgi:hypothetical protein